jgi:Na+(H+)/acetate symporter ActP
MILLMKSNIIFGTPAPIVNDFFGISAEGIGTIGMILNFAVALIVSRVTAAAAAGDSGSGRVGARAARRSGRHFGALKALRARRGH